MNPTSAEKPHDPIRPHLAKIPISLLVRAYPLASTTTQTSYSDPRFDAVRNRCLHVSDRDRAENVVVEWRLRGGLVAVGLFGKDDEVVLAPAYSRWP